MSFDSTRMRENPGEVFDITYRDGSAGSACWVPLGAGGDKHIWTDCGWRYDDGGTNKGPEHPLDIVAYAPRTEERWMIVNDDDSLGERVHRTRPDYAGPAVRVRITVIDEEAA